MGERLIYLDNAATSWPKPVGVAHAMAEFLGRSAGNPGRGAHRMAREAQRVVQEVRSLAAQFFGISRPERVAFFPNVTYALNAALKGLLRAGDHVVMSSVEHNAVARPLFALERQGVDTSVVRCTAAGSLDPAEVERCLRPETRLVCLTHASNVTGSILPVVEVAALAHRRGALILVDAAQTAGILPINAEDQGIDVLAFTGHKGLLGPTGTGGLYLREGLEIRPLVHGGTGSQSHLRDHPAIMPEALEAGTLNTTGLAGLGAGIRFLLKEGMTRVASKHNLLTRNMLQGLADLPGVIVYGPPPDEPRVPVISVNLPGITADEAAFLLDQVYGICARAGLHCAPLAHETVGTLPAGGTLRFSPGYFNTPDDVDHAVQAVKEILADSC